MLENLLDNQDQTALLYAAVSLFFFAVLFEFWRRFNEIQKHRAENPLSDRMEKTIHYFAQNKKRVKITNDEYQKLTGVSDATATRDLQKLVELGYLAERGKTKNTYYIETPKSKTHTTNHKRKKK